MAAANDLEMVVCMHVGSSSTLPQIAKDAPFMANLTWGASRTSGTMLAWLFSGLFQRYPNLKIALSEGEIGWIPYFLERAEQVLDKQRYWVMRGQTFGDHAKSQVMDLDNLDIRQSFRDHVFGCFIEDHHGVASLEEIGEDNVMCETDYPHSDSTWPDCIGTVQRVIKGLDAGDPVQAAPRATPSGSTGSRRPSHRSCDDGLVARDRSRPLYGQRRVRRVRARHVRPRRRGEGHPPGSVDG